MKDFVRPFIFQNANIRGRLIYIKQVIEDCCQHQHYPAIIKNVIIRSLLYNILLHSLIKIDAIITLQIQNPASLLKLVVSEMYNKNSIRASCRYDEILKGSTIDYATLFDGTLLSFTIDPEDTKLERYQGIVQLKSGNLDDAIIDYFTNSEQSDTLIKSAIQIRDNSFEAACIMLQKLPAESLSIATDKESDWERVSIFFETISEADLFKLTKSTETLLPRIFSEDEIILFESEEILYRCRCSLERIQNVLDQMHINPEDKMEIKCEYCGKLYKV